MCGRARDVMEGKENKEKENGEIEAAPVATVTVAAAEREELPKTIVRRLVKDKLSQISRDSEISVLRESLQAFSESARIFIHYLSATANDVCKESKRQIINAEDVFKALEEIDFQEFVGPLRASLEEFRKKNAGKKSGLAKESNRKGKRKEPPVADEDKEDGNKSDEEFSQKNAGKKSGLAKESSRKGKRKEQPEADEKDKEGSRSDEGEDSAND